MIRPARLSDLPAIEEIYAIARDYMQKSGNPNQWVNGYPRRELLESDVSKNQLFVYESEGVIHGSFVFMTSPDPTYAYIEGEWPNEKPYGTIHRIASDGQEKGVFTHCFRFALENADEIRIDTHHDNKTMQHVVEKHGFKRCGVIYLENGDPRIAYQYSKE